MTIVKLRKWRFNARIYYYTEKAVHKYVRIYKVCCFFDSFKQEDSFTSFIMVVAPWRAGVGSFVVTAEAMNELNLNRLR